MKKLLATFASSIFAANTQAAAIFVINPILTEYRESGCVDRTISSSVTFGGEMYDMPVNGIFDYGLLTMTGVLEARYMGVYPIRYTFDLGNGYVPAPVTTFTSGTVVIDVDVGSGWINYTTIDASVTGIPFTPGQSDCQTLSTAGLAMTTVIPPSQTFSFPGLYATSIPATLILPPNLIGGVIFIEGTLGW